MQEAKEKEKKLKAAGGGGGEGGAGTEELLLQIQALTTEKAREEELRSFMQLERVGTPHAAWQLIFRVHRLVCNSGLIDF